MAKINPFSGICESKAYPHARTLRTGPWQKVKDTFRVFSGVFLEDDDNRNHIGLFDCATLMIPYGFTQLSFWCINTDKGIRNPKSILAACLFPIVVPAALLLAVPRYVFAAVATIAVAPFIFITHKVASILAEPHKERVANLTVKEVRGSKPQLLHEYLRAHQTTLSDLRVVSAEVCSTNSISIALKSNNLNENLSSNADLAWEEVHVQVEFDRTSEKSRKDFLSFLSLNAGRAATKLEGNNFKFESLASDDIDVTSSLARLLR